MSLGRHQQQRISSRNPASRLTRSRKLDDVIAVGDVLALTRAMRRHSHGTIAESNEARSLKREVTAVSASRMFLRSPFNKQRYILDNIEYAERNGNSIIITTPTHIMHYERI